MKRSTPSYYKQLSIALCFLMFSGFSFAQKKKDKELDNKTFITELLPQGGKKTPKPIADELNFKSDKMKSKAMVEEYTFTPAPYTVTIDTSNSEKVISFDCEAANKDDETIHWVGTVKGETIEGTATVSKKGKVKKEYTFTGTLKGKKK